MPDVPEKYNRTNPRHRIMVEYAAYGKSPKEIADATGFSMGYVQGVLRSPLFQSEVANTQDAIRQNTMKVFADKIAEETMPSLVTLTSIRDDVQARAADRVSAADKVIGRALDIYAPKGAKGNADDGKRTVRVTIEGGDLHGLMNAIREADGKDAIDVTEGSRAERMQYETQDLEPVRVRTIEEMIAEDDEIERW